MTQAGDIIVLQRGAYTLRETIAQSSYGVVWRADGPGSRSAAIKLVNGQQMAGAGDEQRERWISAARNELAFLQALAPWDEAHIVRLLDWGERGGLPVLALELLDTDLARHNAMLRNIGCAPTMPQVLAWLEQINQALAKVHQYGWRHLDLKPANVLLDVHQGRVKLTDFGCNRPRATTLHYYAGTPNWQAPEQFQPLAGDVYGTDERTDFFALGALFYFLVAGLPLRFCAECGQAWREAPHAASEHLRARYQGALPPTLRDDEARLFLYRFTHSLREDEGIALPEAAGQLALQLLRALLAPAPEGRPPHALAISRQLDAIALAIAAGERSAAPASGWLGRMGLMARAAGNARSA